MEALFTKYSPCDHLGRLAIIGRNFIAGDICTLESINVVKDFIIKYEQPTQSYHVSFDKRSQCLI